MFAFLRRPARRDAGDRSPGTSADPRIGDEKPGWTDSASDLLKGADVVEYNGDFAATVFLEHFVEQSPAAAAQG